MPPRISKTNEDILRDFDDWLAARGGTAGLKDVLDSGNHLLFAGMLLKNFRKATRQAVFDKFKLEAGKLGFEEADSSTPAFFFMIDRIADAWSLTNAEKLALLGCETDGQFEGVRNANFSDIPVEVLERAAILLDIYSVLHSIFADVSIADDWIRLPNRARLFGGRSALASMVDNGLEMLRAVRRYLWAQAAEIDRTGRE